MSKPIQQAGAIVVRRRNGRQEVLLVSARRSHKRWVLPKGTVERGESARAAALREAREEAGVTGRVRERAGIAAYTARSGRVRVQYFLVEYRRDVDDADEDRRVKWCSLERAIKLVTFPGTRRVLQQSRAKIMVLRPTRKRP